MDLLIYIAIIFGLGLYKVNRTKDITDDIGMMGTAENIVPMSELPISQNLGLVRDPNAFMLIVRQLGLMR